MRRTPTAGVAVRPARPALEHGPGGGPARATATPAARWESRSGMTTPPLLTRPDSAGAFAGAPVGHRPGRDPARPGRVSGQLFHVAARDATPGAGGEAPAEAPDGTEYVVGAPHAFARDRLARAFRPAIERALARCLQRPAVRRALRRRRRPLSGRPEATAAPAPPVADAPPAALPDAGAGSGGSALNPRATFERYIAGRGSEFAVAAARAVADNPALAYNPLYLYGDPGTGKTHLLHAIGNRFLQRRPGAPCSTLPVDGGAFDPAAAGPGPAPAGRRPGGAGIDRIDRINGAGGRRAVRLTVRGPPHGPPRRAAGGEHPGGGRRRPAPPGADRPGRPAAGLAADGAGGGDRGAGLRDPPGPGAPAGRGPGGHPAPGRAGGDRPPGPGRRPGAGGAGDAGLRRGPSCPGSP